MKDLSYISREISKGKNLEQNLSKYGTAMSSMYNTLAYIKLSMNYYTVYDMQREECCKAKQYTDLLKRFHELVGEMLSGELKSVEKIEALRNDIIKVMEVVTAYVDHLRIYEYVLNRLEYRFKEDASDNEYYNTYMTNDLMHYILSDKDNVVIHSKIAEVVEQLPMRLSRSKFYEYVREAFTLYHGAQKGTVDDFAYSLRTTATISIPDEFDTMFPDMKELLDLLLGADYASIDEAEYNRLSNAVKLGAEKMTDCADAFVLLAQIVNDLYTIVLTGKAAFEDVEEVITAKAVVESVYNDFTAKVPMIDEEVLDRFVLFEGRQERILMTVSECDYIIEQAQIDYSNELSAYGLADIYEALTMSVKLQSGSDFVALVTDKNREEEADDSYVDRTCEEFISDLDAVFKKNSQPVRRAVMSTVLSQLPVFFNNTEEIQEYINVSLMQCTDKAEQRAVVDIFKIIMANN